jgi:hypothetical protein
MVRLNATKFVAENSDDRGNGHEVTIIGCDGRFASHGVVLPLASVPEPSKVAL